MKPALPEVLILALPLIISIGAGTVQMFFDRIFLNWYSDDAMAGAMQAGIASFSIASFFLGTVSYVILSLPSTSAHKKTTRGSCHLAGCVLSLCQIADAPAYSLRFRIFKFFGHEQQYSRPKLHISDYVYRQLPRCF